MTDARARSNGLRLTDATWRDIFFQFWSVKLCVLLSSVYVVCEISRFNFPQKNVACKCLLWPVISSLSGPEGTRGRPDFSLVTAQNAVLSMLFSHAPGFECRNSQSSWGEWTISERVGYSTIGRHTLPQGRDSHGPQRQMSTVDGPWRLQVTKTANYEFVSLRKHRDSAHGCETIPFDVSCRALDDDTHKSRSVQFSPHLHEYHVKSLHCRPLA